MVSKAYFCVFFRIICYDADPPASVHAAGEGERLGHLQSAQNATTFTQKRCLQM